MYTSVILVHYHELGLKGHNRASFEQALVKNLKFALRDQPVEATTRISGRIRIILGNPDARDVVAAIALATPGVVRVSCGYKTPRNLDDIIAAAKIATREAGDFLTFKVVSRRSNTDFETTSMEMNQIVGAALCEEFPDKIVRMKNPDLSVHVEVIQGSAYVYGKTDVAIGGLPVGTAGKVISLLSSGIDSPVSTWRMMRRGATIIGLHFSGRPQTPNDSEYAVDEIAHSLKSAVGIARIYIVPFGNYQRQIAAICPADLRILMYRRLMFAVAERLAKIEGAKGLVTGESLGQVASQTFDNMAVVNDAVTIPVYRPLIGNDKQEIIAEAIKIGTYEVSSRNCADCCTLFMPRNPETHANLEKVRDVWAKLPVEEMIESILNEIEYIDYPCNSYRAPKRYPKQKA